MKNIKLFGKRVPILAVMVVLMIASASAAAVYFEFRGDVTVQSPFGGTMDTPIDYDATLFAGDDIQATVPIPNTANTPILVELETLVNGSAIPDGLTLTYVDTDGIVLSDVDGDEMQELLLPAESITYVGISAYTTPVLLGGELIDENFLVTTNIMEPIDVDFVGLASKNTTTWQPDGIMSGYVIYETESDVFNFAVKATGLNGTNVDYDLIYYADEPNRFVSWGGADPSMVVATITTGAYLGAGNNGLFMNSANNTGYLPHVDDANADAVNHDYRGSPDFYNKATGAKLWLVPTGELAIMQAGGVGSWNPSEYLMDIGLVDTTPI